MMAGSTNNVCNGCFGCLKRDFAAQDVLTLRDMTDCIDLSAQNTKCIPSPDVIWLKWKPILEKYFYIPAYFKISKFQVIKFNKDFSGCVFGKDFLDSEDEQKFRILKKLVIPDYSIE